MAALLASGFSPQLDERCHHEEIDAHEVWRRTRSALALNPYKIVSESSPGRRGRAEVDLDFTRRIMSYCRTKLGYRCVLENSSIRYPPVRKALPMHDAMRSLGPPIGFQTATMRKVGDLALTLDWAVSQGASSVELPEGYDVMPPDVLRHYDDLLRANPSR